ncbi:hypothetical protein LOZ29_001165 [Ophidiomyces ophidiicola]|nr:hypothetical protein LOZ46_001942 [Ophidiomyces ophidiicola]KAI2143407.1 hypothetical protein LOZ29_001165 [Ophidiomyces ophidiicola]KAI2146123.1 hypothetical protein LOZ28_000927 [Ophidiomyces ophidiicola]KAI2224272.1 hypothetical protein LOZ15_000827 [Ophidiomyces ophidiicola]
MAKWNIEADIAATITSARMKPGFLSIDADIVLQEVGCVDHEHYLCGDEQSVCGRYAQNALAPVSAVAFHNGLKYRFGDYKVSSDSTYPGNGTYLPDFVAVSCPATNLKTLQELTKGTPHDMMLVGEAKTPWKHDLMAAWNDVKRDEQDLRHAFGQIVTYMQRLKMRYAFLTTYNYTIFLRQELREGNPILYYTRPISSISSPERGGFSIRQCFYYLISKNKDPRHYRIDNPILPLHWIGGSSEYKLMKDDVSQEPITPFSERTAPSATMFQVGTKGVIEMKQISPLQLLRDGTRFKATIFFDENYVKGLDPNHRSVIINGKAIRVVLEGDSDAHGNPPYRHSEEESIHPELQPKQGAHEKRNVKFEFYSSQEDESDSSLKGKGSLFDAFERAKEPSRSEEQIGVDPEIPHSQRDSQRLFNPKSKISAYKHGALGNLGQEDLYQSDGARVYPDMVESPSPATRTDRERGLTSSGRTDQTPYANPYSNTPHSQYDTQRLSETPQPVDPASRGLPHRSRDKGKEKSERSEKSDEGRKLRSSGKSTDQQPPKKGGPSLSGRSSKKR